MTRPIALTIPPDWRFSDLQLARDSDGEIGFNLDALQTVMSAEDHAWLLDHSEDHLADVLAQLYAITRAYDPVMEELREEILREDYPLTAAEAAEHLKARGIEHSAKRLTQLVQDGTLPEVRVTGARGTREYRFRAADLDEYKPRPRGWVAGRKRKP